MRVLARYRPSASMVVAIIAVVAASVGTAIGAPGKGSSTTLTYVSDRTPDSGFDGEDNKTARAVCPPGEVLVDEGAQVDTDGDANSANTATDPDEAAAISEINPAPNTPGPTEVLVKAQEFANNTAVPSQQTANWALTAEGWCRD